MKPEQAAKLYRESTVNKMKNILTPKDKALKLLITFSGIDDALNCVDEIIESQPLNPVDSNQYYELLSDRLR